MLGQLLTYLPAMILARLAGFAVLIGAAHLLDPTSTGLLALALLTAELAEGIFLNWLRIFVLRHGAESGKISPATARLCLLFWLAGIVAAALLVAIIGILVVGPSAAAFIGVVTASVLALSLFKGGLVLLQMAGRARRHAVLEGTRGLLMAPLAIWAVLAGGGWIEIAALIAAITGATGLAAVWLARDLIAGTDDHHALPDMIAMVPPLIGLATLNFLIGSIDRFALSALVSPSAVAPYATSYALGRQGFDIATNAVNAGGFPALVAARARGDRQQLGEQARLLIALLLAGYVGLVLMRHDLSALLLPEEFREEAATLLPNIGLGALALNLKNGLTDNVLLIENQYWRQMIGLSAGSAVAVGMALWLVPAWGGVGAAIGFATGAVTVLSVSFWQARPHMTLTFGWAAITRIASPPILVATTCAGALLLFPDASSGVRLAVAIAVSAPLSLWALQPRPEEVAPHGG